MHIADELFEFFRINIVHILPTIPFLIGPHSAVEIPDYKRWQAL